MFCTSSAQNVHHFSLVLLNASSEQHSQTCSVNPGNGFYSKSSFPHVVIHPLHLATQHLFLSFFSFFLSNFSECGGSSGRLHLFPELPALFVPVATLRPDEPCPKSVSLPHLQRGHVYGSSAHRNVWRQRWEVTVEVNLVNYNLYLFEISGCINLSFPDCWNNI